MHSCSVMLGLFCSSVLLKDRNHIPLTEKFLYIFLAVRVTFHRVYVWKLVYEVSW